MDDSTPHRLTGEPTMAQVAGWMRRFAHGPQGKESLNLRGFVEDVVRDVDSGDYCSEINACYYWVCRNIKYRKDILGVEFVKTPEQTLRTKCGDCDDIATLLAAMLMSLGHKARFILVSFHKGGAPSHVFCAAVMPDGSAIPLDPVANRVTATMLQSVRDKLIVDLGDVDDDYEGKEQLEDEDTGLGYEARRGGDPAAGRRIDRIFSVWDYPTAKFAYYTAKAPPVAATGGYRKPRGGTPESIAAVLPAGATKVGEGPRAKGAVATLGGIVLVGGGVSDALFTLAKVGAAGGAAYLLWRWWKRRKKRRST